MQSSEEFNNASIKTAAALKSIAHSHIALSRLSLPEIDQVSEQVSRVIPAGNVPGMILSGLARLPGRTPPIQNVKRDIDFLFKGVEQVLDKAVYGMFFAGPAAVIWGYQNLLKLAGKDPEDAFPQGVWQFYVDYAMREDTARHSNETHGFDTRLRLHKIQLNTVDRATAWVMAAIHNLHQYHHLLENEWRERIYTYLLWQLTVDEPEAILYRKLYNTWEKQRPYSRGGDSPAGDTYPAYRRRKFDHFLEEATAKLRPELRSQWAKQVEAANQQNLPAFLHQMSILAYLKGDAYGETQEEIALKDAHIGLIFQNCYYLIPACAPNSQQPAELATVRQQIATLMARPVDFAPAPLSPLARIQRSTLAGLRPKMSCAAELEMLRLTPILINCDQSSPDLPLAELRQGERGLGDHALTIFDTGKTFIFDQSHIFFDGAWGSALAEILTNEALAWAVYLNSLPPAEAGSQRPYTPNFQFQATDKNLINQALKTSPEASGETDAVDIKAILKLRRLFKQRSDLIQLTVNDLLILYRAIQAATYQADPELIAALRDLERDNETRLAAQTALAAIEESKQLNPAIVIPVDASQRSPQDRLYPMTFEVPLKDLDLINLHQRVVSDLDTYKSSGGDRGEAYTRFNEGQRVYLATLAGFGAVLSKAKEIAMIGQSASMGTIKLMAHIPKPLQRMMDTIPDQFDMLNDLIKGREVISNVGAVVPGSTLTRFITAKDDNEKKTLAWGILTDAQGVMRISLRDFRPHVALLQACDRQDIAAWITQDYLDNYALGLNTYIKELQKITRSSRKTRLEKGFGNS